MYMFNMYINENSYISKRQLVLSLSETYKGAGIISDVTLYKKYKKDLSHLPARISAKNVGEVRDEVLALIGVDIYKHRFTPHSEDISILRDIYGKDEFKEYISFCKATHLQNENKSSFFSLAIESGKDNHKAWSALFDVYERYVRNYDAQDIFSIITKMKQPYS